MSTLAPIDNKIVKRGSVFFSNIIPDDNIPSAGSDVLNVNYIANNGIANGYASNIPASIRRVGKMVQVVIGNSSTNIPIAGASTTDIIFTQTVGGINTELVGLEPTENISVPVICRDGGVSDITCILSFRTLLDGSYKLGLRKLNGATFNIASSLSFQRGIVISWNLA
jgi:hypothetical protein